MVLGRGADAAVLSVVFESCCCRTRVVYRVLIRAPRARLRPDCWRELLKAGEQLCCTRIRDAAKLIRIVHRSCPQKASA